MDGMIFLNSCGVVLFQNLRENKKSQGHAGDLFYWHTRAWETGGKKCTPKNSKCIAPTELTLWSE
jgi:hypothetical protein